MNKELNKVRFDGMKKGWDESQTWEMGQEGPSATDRESFKTGYLNGFDDGFQEAVKLLKNVDAMKLDLMETERRYVHITLANWLHNLFKEKQND